MEVKNPIPEHIAIIMDGNGRWARERKLPRIFGHREGTKRVKEIVFAAGKLGVKVLTLFAFSTENWSRPRAEVAMLIRYFEGFLNRELREMKKHNVRFKVIGRERPLPEALIRKIRAAEKATALNTGVTLVLAVNYGARQELVDAARKICDLLSTGSLKNFELDEETFAEYLDTKGLPDPDLVIRTSGEQRLSNFLLWQASYAELYFPKVYWPDFHAEDLEQAIKEYQRRQRKFGSIEVKQPHAH